VDFEPQSGPEEEEEEEEDDDPGTLAPRSARRRRTAAPEGDPVSLATGAGRAPADAARHGRGGDVEEVVIRMTR